MREIQPEKIEGVSEVSKIYYPTVHFNSKELPEIKDWEVGKTYELKLKVKQKSMREAMHGEEKMRIADFDIIGVEVLDKGLNSEQKRIKTIMNNERDEITK